MTSTADYLANRAALIVDAARRGAELCAALSKATDEWLTTIATAAFNNADAPVALVAVGGYGRAELCPASDLDLVVVHQPSPGIDQIAEAIWYPIWDSGLKLGHAVLTLNDAKRLSADEMDSATSFLSTRLIVGDAALAEAFAQQAAAAWRGRRSGWLQRLGARTAERHDNVGEVAFLLEPDLKEGRGGLRDVHALGWAEQAGLELGSDDRMALASAYATLLDVRVELHRSTDRRGDVLRLDDQDVVAQRTGHASADDLMASVASAARTISWIGSEAWWRIGAEHEGSLPSDRSLAPGISLRNGEVQLAESRDPATDPEAALRLACAAARCGAPIGRATLNRLSEATPVFPDPWPAGAVDELVALLLEGHRAIAPLEALDQVGVLVRVLPEWQAVRNKPQRNAYHRFTVDRHLWEAIANAADLVVSRRISRPDLLVLGALLHDLGKGLPGDHTDRGVELAERIGPRLGFGPQDAGVLVALVRHHLLLPDVATRRDLSDDATITSVAAAVETPLVLELLHALTEADSLATGPSAWGSWKAELVGLLVDRVGHVLGGGDVSEVTWRLFPSDEVLGLMAAGHTAVIPHVDRIVTVAPDRPGLFGRVAGVISIHGLDVLAAEAYSDDVAVSSPPSSGSGGGVVTMAANEFRVAVPKHGIDWARLVTDLERALCGQLAIEARLADRARTYRRKRSTAAEVAEPQVRLDNDASSDATVIEVRARDRVGLLHRITKALAELELDIRHAKIQTIGPEVVDTFYVRSAGAKLVDPFHIGEVERALLHAVAEPARAQLSPKPSVG
jgi:[protein-PII] uridylyltransferase